MLTQSNLYLKQSYMDTWDDYNRSLTNTNFACWDYVVLTASNEQQAEGFKAQIEERQNAGFLPSRTHFAVIPDPDGKRVGSGGATLGVIKYIAQHAGVEESGVDFSGLRILVIHSGGDSKRVPQYSALGKLFSPVPHELPNGRISTLFDEFMMAMSSVPARIQDGMLILSGDVLLLFNPLQIDSSGEGATAISFKEDVQVGKNHGVYLRGQDGNVKKFLHKQSVEMLKEQGAVNDRGAVDIDTGAVLFSPDMVKSLYGLISQNGKVKNDLFNKYVNETVRLSLYGDFLYPLATDSTLEAFYKEKPEGDYCDELLEARTVLWDILRPYKMKLLRLAPAKFIHFGTTKEILHLMSEGIENYRVLGWDRQVKSSINNDVAGYNSILSDDVVAGKGCYAEVSYVHDGSVLGDNVLLSHVDIQNKTIPSDVVLHGLKQKDGKFVVRIYGVHDNPKGTLEEDSSFLGGTLKQFLDKNNISQNELWDTDSHTLWQANLYPTCDNVGDAVNAALNIYNMAQGEGDVSSWRESKRKSLCAGFNEADPYALIAWDKKMQELVQMNQLASFFNEGGKAADAKNILTTNSLTKTQKQWLSERLKTADYKEAMRLHYFIGTAVGGAEGENHINECFKALQSAILESSLCGLEFNNSCTIVKDKHTVKLPLRVNWGGGWSDTPPYCNENGGTVLNAAILLDGELPVEVRLEKINENKIIFESRDMGVYGEFDTIEALQKTGDPYDPFALQKAALIACGIIPSSGGNFDEILARLGGGFRMNSEVTNVPKGSGLGTSSILSGACVKALLEFVGIEYTNSDLYNKVLCMEQIMATGGGWQDQVGGLTNGIKFITSTPGINQKVNVRNVEISPETRQELNERLALIYTGQRRLARNLLRDVVGRYVGNEPDALFALNEIQRVAALMKFELERGHVDDFAKLLDYHWSLSKKVDEGSSNTLIDQIFDSIEDLIDGKLVCGAGGGGFLQVVLKKGVTKDEVQSRLKDVFQDNDVKVWDIELI